MSELEFSNKDRNIYRLHGFQAHLRDQLKTEMLHGNAKFRQRAERALENRTVDGYIQIHSMVSVSRKNRGATSPTVAKPKLSTAAIRAELCRVQRDLENPHWQGGYAWMQTCLRSKTISDLSRLLAKPDSALVIEGTRLLNSLAALKP